MLDERILLAMRVAGDTTDPIGPKWLEELARDVTALGSIGLIGFLTLSSAGFLALQRKSHTALYLVLAVTTGVVASFVLKAVFARPRPDLVAQGQAVYTSSFPSSHSMLSAVAFLTLGALLAGTLESRRLKAYLLGLAALLAAAVGISRVYLGVHWPTDVLAGWTAGAAWALACWMIAHRLRQRGAVE
jgi:undecaprenyl-diphosphatase